MEPIRTLGTILETEQERDCIHIAIAPVIAAHSLRPGDRIGLNEHGEADNLVDVDLGVVDPFLKTPVKRGQRFWMFLLPNSITSLRHEWIHPAFNGPSQPNPERISKQAHVAKSEAWIAEHAAELGLTADVLMENAEGWLASTDTWGGYYVQQGSERWRDYFRPTEFWHHYEVVTGKVVPEDKKQSFYCCSC